MARSSHSTHAQARAAGDGREAAGEKGIVGMWAPEDGCQRMVGQADFFAQLDSSGLARVEAISGRYITELCEVSQELVIAIVQRAG
jgi:hypothetical protein